MNKLEIMLHLSEAFNTLQKELTNQLPDAVPIGTGTVEATLKGPDETPYTFASFAWGSVSELFEDASEGVRNRILAQDGARAAEGKPLNLTPLEQFQALNVLDYIRALFTTGKETLTREEVLVILDDVRSSPEIFDPQAVIAHQIATAEPTS